MKLLGLTILVLAAAPMVYEHTEKIKKQAREYSATKDLFEYIRASLSTSKKHLSEILKCYFSTGAYNDLPWIESVMPRSSSFFGQEFDRFAKIDFSSSFLSLSDREKISSFFLNFGKASYKEEKTRLEEIADFFKQKASSKLLEREKQVKLAWLLFSTAFLGLFIILI